MFCHYTSNSVLLPAENALSSFAKFKRIQIPWPWLLILALLFASGTSLPAQTNPVYVSTASYASSTARDVVVSENHAYVANFDYGLRIYNVSNPTNPIGVGNGFLDFETHAFGVAKVGPYVYLAADYGLHVYNVSNPTNPISLTQNFTGKPAHAVAISGNYAYLAQDYDGLGIYNISNPTNVTFVSSTNGNGSFLGAFAQGVAVSGNYAYLADIGYGLRVFDISNKSKPNLVGQFNVPGGAFCVALSGRYAYLACQTNGLRIIDISNPASPIGLGQINNSTPGSRTRGVTISGNYAYLANADDGLRIYDVSDPANPIHIAHPESGLQGHTIAISGNYAYMASREQQLRIYHLGIPPAPPLDLMPTTTNTLTLSWPAPSAAFTLQQNPDLNTTNWTNLTAPSEVVSNHNQIILPTPATNQFYRLKSL